MAALNWVGRHELFCDAMRSFFAAPELPVELFGLRFPNPIGLAAGMDKNALALPAWEAMGFGFTELGAATWHAQPGNPQPRVFRAISEQAIVNRMGFNNLGAEAIAEKLIGWKNTGRWPNHPVGMNLGKSKITPLDKAAEDYANSFRVLRAHLDFFVVNVSSPNTPNLRQLQDKAALDEILGAIQEVQSSRFKVQGSECTARSEGRGSRVEGSSPCSLAPPHPDPLLHSAEERETKSPGLPVQKHQPSQGHSHSKPILVKVAPDLSFEALDDILELAGPRQIAGIVATNTTITRPRPGRRENERIYAETGGLSGQPLRARSSEVIRHLFRQTQGKLPIIGVGGIFNAEDAWEKIAAGASLLQVYTGLVYEGPGICRNIINGLMERMESRGFSTLQQGVGGGAE